MYVLGVNELSASTDEAQACEKLLRNKLSEPRGQTWIQNVWHSDGIHEYFPF